jgi:hypothetical protein
MDVRQECGVAAQLGGSFLPSGLLLLLLRSLLLRRRTAGVALLESHCWSLRKDECESVVTGDDVTTTH